MNYRGNAKMNSSRTFNKPKNTKYALKRIADYLLKFKWWLIIALILTILSNVFSLLGPLLSGYAIGAIELGEGKVNFDEMYKCRGDQCVKNDMVYKLYKDMVYKF